MIDEVLRYLPSQAEISKDEFHFWKKHKVTEQLFIDLLASLLDQCSDDLPDDSIDKTVILAHQREGAKRLLETLQNWKPLSVRKIQGDDDEA